MITGTIRTALGDADHQDLRAATDLIGLAAERVIEHLQLALELSRRMHGATGSESGPTYG